MRVQVEQCARDLAKTINSGAADWRQQLRDTAITLLKDEVDLVDPALVPFSEAPAGGAGAQTSNPFAMAIPLFMVGAVLVILFPPVGLLLIAVAAAMAVWGLAAVLLRR